jgi:hypothetical protein
MKTPSSNEGDEPSSQPEQKTARVRMAARSAEGQRIMNAFVEQLRADGFDVRIEPAFRPDWPQ